MQVTANPCERVAMALRSLYNQYGYRQYHMSKFEEYDLYARNKDFLISDNVITFTDLSGKLMALKPDVTLSIVKNSKDLPTVQKVYYNENVYRVTKGSQGFREIMQVGLECLGPIDDLCISEVLALAGESLLAVSSDVILDVSHLGLLSQLMASIGLPKEKRDELVKAISEKNAHELTALCRNVGVADADTELLRQLLAIKGTPAAVLPQLETLLAGRVEEQTLSQFTNVIRSLEGTDVEPMLRIDFSVVDDIHYYNGFVFKGFINGLPGSVLSGGQYDKLMQKMKRTDRAIGFAVYLDMLERLEDAGDAYDVDAVLLYDNTTALSVIRRKAKELIDSGLSVMLQQAVPEDCRYRQLMKITNGEVQTIETNA